MGAYWKEGAKSNHYDNPPEKDTFPQRFSKRKLEKKDRRFDNVVVYEKKYHTIVLFRPIVFRNGGNFNVCF